MSLITEKLKSLGVPDAIVSGLEEKLGEKLEGEIQSLGLKAAAEKAGVDLSSLPDIDLSHLVGVGADMLGKTDTDGDGKTGMEEVKDTISDLADSSGVSSIMEKAKDIAIEARGVDADGDGKTGVLEAVEQAKEVVAEARDTVMQSPVGEKVADIAGDAKDAVMSSEIGAKVATAAESVSEQAGGFFGKIRSFFGV